MCLQLYIGHNELSFPTFFYDKSLSEHSTNFLIYNLKKN